MRVDGRPASIDLSSFKSVSIGGIVHSDSGISEHHWGEQPATSVTAAEAFRWTGEWLSIFKRGQLAEYIITADFFGYCPVFYSFTSHGLVVSSSLRGMTKELEHHASHGQVNWDAAHPHLVTNETMFNMRASVESLRRDVWTLRPDEYLYVDGTRASIHQKSFFKDPEDRSAEELFARGVERAVSQIQETISQHSGRIDYSISGGKDSRAVLALLLIADASDKVETYTHDPELFPAGASRDVIDRDFPIALHLAERYGLKWRKPRHSDGVRTTLDDSLNRFQDWRGGQSFQFNGQLVRWHFRSGPRVELAGGGGELYRSHFGSQTLNGYPAWAKLMLGGKEGVRHDLETLFDVMCSAETIPAEIHTRAKRAFVNTMDTGYGQSALDAVDSFYPLQRNRHHFGQIRMARLEGKLTLYPLAQPEFFWAHNAMQSEERTQGRLLFDLMKLGDPYLNAIPFEHGQWPKAFGHSLAQIDLRKPSAAALAGYREMQQARRTSEEQFVSPDMSSKTTNRMMESLTPDSIEWLLRSGQDTRWLRSILPRIAMTESLGRASLLNTVGKVQTLVDSISAPGARTNRMVFDNANVANEKVAPSELTGGREFLLTRHRYSIEGVESSLLQNSGGLAVRVEGADVGLEVAVYIYIGGDLVEKVWYQKLTNHQVNLELGALRHGVYRATVFLRHEGMKNPQKVLETNMINVE